MMKGINWQMMAFVGVSLLQDYLAYLHLPKVYYWDQQNFNNDD